MKLCKILVRHCSSKDNHESIEKYVICNNEEEVFNHIYKSHITYLDEETLEDYMKCRGEYFSEYANWDDGYYGVTHYGWEEPIDINEEELIILKKFNIIEDIRK